MPSTFSLPTGKHLFVERSEAVPRGVKLGVQMNAKLAVSVHLDRAEAVRLAERIVELCGTTEAASPAPRRRWWEWKR